MFEVNEKVVCVDDKDQRDEYSTPEEMDVEHGKVYVVREIESNFGEVGVRLVGMFAGWNHPFGVREEWSYRASRFRKLSDIQAENKTKRMEKLINSPLPKGNPLKKHFS